MNSARQKENYEKAKKESDAIDEYIIKCLNEGRSVLVEAGAGSGKTYSLDRVIDWIQRNKWEDYKKKRQHVACITFTNAAVDVIRRRLKNGSFIVPSTIHAFAWEAISQYQSTLQQIVSTEEIFETEHSDQSDIKKVAYTLGHRYIEKGIYYLYHDDVLNLFSRLLDKPKFRRIFADKYPIILIDEYQDSNRDIINQFIAYFISKKHGPQFAFFGDAWQTIYQSNKACGKITDSNLETIKKPSNFRSAPRIVNFLNKLRPQLPQLCAKDDCTGEIFVITSDNFHNDNRFDKGYYKGNLKPEVMQRCITEISKKIKSNVPCSETTKSLMITHKLLAAQQGYDELLDILGDKFKEKEDPILQFVINILEPIYDALSSSNSKRLFDVLGVKRYPIEKKSNKTAWKRLYMEFRTARTKTLYDVFSTIRESRLVPIPPKLEELFAQLKKSPDSLYTNNVTFYDFFNIPYRQFYAAVDFFKPDAGFSTEHGVKGEEYDNVIFVISKGWNLYQFEKYAPMIEKPSSVPVKELEAYERNRNLFYVCCSRPIKRLFIFVSIPLDNPFRNFLTRLVGVENIVSYKEFIEQYQLPSHPDSTSI